MHCFYPRYRICKWRGFLVQRIMPTSGQNNLTYSPRHNTCLLPSSRHWLLRCRRRRSSLSQICALSLQCTCSVMFLPKSTHQKNWPTQKRTRQMNPIILLTYTISHRTPLGSPKSATSCLHCRNQAIFYTLTCLALQLPLFLRRGLRHRRRHLSATSRAEKEMILHRG